MTLHWLKSLAVVTALALVPCFLAGPAAAQSASPSPAPSPSPAASPAGDRDKKPKRVKKDDELTGPELVKRVRVLLLLLRNQERKAKPLTERIDFLAKRNDTGSAGKVNAKRIDALEKRRDVFLKRVVAYKKRIDRLVPTLDKTQEDTKTLLANCRLRNIQDPAYDPKKGSEGHRPPCPKAVASPAPGAAPAPAAVAGAPTGEDDDDPNGLFDGELAGEPEEPDPAGDADPGEADPGATDPGTPVVDPGQADPGATDTDSPK